MDRITGTSNRSLPGANTTLTMPTYVPVGSCPGVAVTSTEPCENAAAEPEVETVSQFPPEFVLAVALNVRAWLPRFETFRYCEAAGAATTAENVSPRGSTATCGPLPP